MTTSRRTTHSPTAPPPTLPLSATLERELARAVKQVRSRPFLRRLAAPEHRRATVLVTVGAVAATVGLAIGTIQFLRLRQSRREVAQESAMIDTLEQVAAQELVTEFAALAP